MLLAHPQAITYLHHLCTTCLHFLCVALVYMKHSRTTIGNNSTERDKARNSSMFGANRHIHTGIPAIHHTTTNTYLPSITPQRKRDDDNIKRADFKECFGFLLVTSLHNSHQMAHGNEHRAGRASVARASGYYKDLFSTVALACVLSCECVRRICMCVHTRVPHRTYTHIVLDHLLIGA